MVSSASGAEIIFWDFTKLKVLKREKANAWIIYNAKFVEGTNYIATGQSNGQLRLYGNISFRVQAETPALKTWSRATAFNWTHPSLKNVMYQGYEDGIIREWNFDPETKQFKRGFEEWGHLDAIRDIIPIPEYDLLISTSRVLVLL